MMRRSPIGQAAAATLLCACAAVGAYAQLSYAPSWSGYVGGDWDVDGVHAVAADSQTNTYIGGFLGQGEIRNAGGISPTPPSYYQGARDGFVAKLTPAGALAWYLCLGREENDRVTGVALHTNGTGYACGVFERTAFEDGGTDAALASFASSTGAAGWSLALGETGGTNGFNAVAVDADGYIYAAGYTTLASLPGGVPGYTVGATLYGTALQGDTDAVVVKVSPQGAIVWSHYLGGTNADAATACALGPDGSLYVGGETRSPGWASIPSGAPSPANPDGFLVKLTTAGAHVWSAFLGGSAADAVRALARAPDSAALLVGGSTASANFLSGAPRLNAPAGGEDGFVLRLTDLGAAFQTNWCRFAGGAAADRVAALALLPGGRAVAGGATASAGWLPAAGDSAFGGVQDGFLLLLDAAGGPLWSAYVGGDRDDELRALAAPGGSLLAVGSTFSAGWVSGGFWDIWTKEEWFEFAGDFGFVGKWLADGQAGDPPSLITQPEDAAVQEGQPATFRATAQGTAPLVYRWLRNGADVTGPTSNSYTLAAAALADSGATFACLVSNSVGTATSRAALLTVTPKPKGTLTVTLTPAEAAAAGAAWSVDAGLSWLGGGAATNLAEGLYTVSFKAVAGWLAPAALTNVQVLSGQTASRSAAYTPVLPQAERAIAGTNAVLTVRPPAGTTVWLLAETLPAGLAPTAFSAGGSWDANSRTLSFSGVGSAVTLLNYTVSGAKGVYDVSGTFTPYPTAVPAAVAGDAQFVLANVVRRVDGAAVTVTVEPPATNIFIWSVEETLPAGLTPQAVSGPNAAWDPVARTLTWTRLGAAGATLAYEVSGPPGTYALSGRATFGGPYEAVYGDGSVTLSEPPPPAPPPPDILGLSPAGAGWLNLSFTSVVSVVYTVQTNADLRAPAGWADCLSVPGAAGVTQQAVPAPGPRLFYRVRAAED